MQKPPESDEVKIWLMFLRAHASLFRSMDSELQRAHGVSLTWMDILVQLSLADDRRMTHTRLGQRVLLSLGGTTRAIDRMVKAGLVEREASLTDRRVSFVVLTEKGTALLSELIPTQFAGVQEQFLQHLRKDDVPAIGDFFKRVLGDE